MTPEKQKLYDAFLAGYDTEQVIMGTEELSRERLRGRFEEWLDEREASANRGVVCEPNEEMRKALGIARSPFKSNLS